ncbi:MAG: dihydropteroate synthase [Firmicutes bacterium]|nr:dihydropteroate synthase [Bacillota bacterium]
MTPVIRLLPNAGPAALRREMQQIGVSPEGIDWMMDKCDALRLRVDGLANPAVLILKQKMLSLGGEAAVSRQALVGGSAKGADNAALLIGSRRQLQLLIPYLRQQPFALPAVAQQLSDILARLGQTPPPVTYANGYIRGSLHFQRPCIMGILNATPDSFYDGGQYTDVDKAAEQALRLVEDGADIVDIGGASSRPGFTPVDAATEQSRILPLIRQLAPQLAVPMSVDTDKVDVAEAALSAGASMINYTGDPQPGLFALAGRSQTPLIVMHKGGGPRVLENIHDFFYEACDMARQAGLAEEQLILDPGIGFDKDPEENLTILQNLEQFSVYGRPLLLGMSNKRFLGAVTGMPVTERTLAGSVAAALTWGRGASIFRVHDAAAARQALAVAEAIGNGKIKEKE